jgi:uncharacterized protein
MKKALFIAGGWEGHFPAQIVQLFSNELQKRGFICDTETSLGILADEARLRTYDLISPCWTMGTLTAEEGRGLQAAVRSGVGLAGLHGGMGDAFRGNLDFEWMVGGHFVGHPHVGEYTVRVKDCASPILQGIPSTFPYKSEQYYMMMDPSVHVLADTEYIYEGRSCAMPVAWIKLWGHGRVFYSALGHVPEEFAAFPVAQTLMMQGLLWAARVL